MNPPLVVYWSRRDFRLRDNPALSKALGESSTQGTPFLPLFIIEDYMCAGDPAFQFGYSSRWFLARALPQFAQHFTQFTVVRGKAARTLIELAQNFTLTIYVNEDIHPDFYKQVRKIAAAGISIHVLKDQMTVARETKTGAGAIYSIFTPFKRAVWQDFMSAPETPVADPTRALPFTDVVAGHLSRVIPCTIESIEKEFTAGRALAVGSHIVELDDQPLPDLSQWYLSESAALVRFDEYLLSGGLAAYKDMRDSLERDAEGTGRTSRMSLALAWGLVSARTLRSKITQHFSHDFAEPDATHYHLGALTFISELIWREFYKYLLYHHPALLDQEFQPKFRGTITWVTDEVAITRFTAWMRGETGYPVVDAAMQQLAQTGWMHNRARMIVASVLTKNFGVDWRWGQEYFRAVLIDLDEASNNGGWQWGASVGADPKPIRIFNAELQAGSHDASGRYQKRWLGDDRYNNPIPPIVPHKQARAEALERYGLASHAPTRDY